jgi:hypothetical protein
VEEVDAETVRKQEAYILFYRRRADARRTAAILEDIKRAEQDDGKGKW